MEYLFVFDPESKGWWLKIDNEDGLMDYFKKINKADNGGLEMYWNLYKEMLGLAGEIVEHDEKSVKEYLDTMPSEKRFSLMVDNHGNFNVMMAAIRYAEEYETTILDGFRGLNMDIASEYLKALRKDGVIYLNQAGGRMFRIDYTQFCRKKELSFPHFTEGDIRIKRFDGGTHYYAYVGNVEVRDSDIKKWNTFDEAYQEAKKLLSE